MDIRECTMELKNHLLRLKDRFDHSEPPENRRDRKFFEMVKEETDPIFRMLEQWEELAIQSIQEKKTGVVPQQITSTKENMEMLLLHSYFIDARPKRYMELHKSVRYIFDQLLRDLEAEKRGKRNDA